MPSIAVDWFRLMKCHLNNIYVYLFEIQEKTSIHSLQPRFQNVKILYKVLHCAHKIKIGLETELIDGSLSNKVN